VETTHYSVVDGEGNAISVTTTINAGFGSGIMVEEAGFLLNNEMDDFAAQPGVPNYYGLVQGEANAIQPFKRPLSSMTPLIVSSPIVDDVVQGEDLYLVLGSPGGPRIITSVLQVLLNVVTYGMGIQEAVYAPRLHHQWLPDTVYVEHRGWAMEAIDGLRAWGQNVRFRAGPIGTVHAILVDSTGVQYGAPDPRRGGCAKGLMR
jgi:gamma-glutamyltranspeptidase/glutathione hydrolase